MWRHNKVKKDGVLIVYQYSHVIITSFHIREKDRDKGGVCIENLREKSVEGHPKLNGIGVSMLAHNVIETTVFIAINDPRPPSFLGNESDRDNPEVG